MPAATLRGEAKVKFKMLSSSGITAALKGSVLFPEERKVDPIVDIEFEVV